MKTTYKAQFNLSGEAGTTDWCDSREEAFEAYDELVQAYNKDLAEGDDDEAAYAYVAEHDAHPLFNSWEVLEDGTERSHAIHPQKGHGYLYLEEKQVAAE